MSYVYVGTCLIMSISMHSVSSLHLVDLVSVFVGLPMERRNGLQLKIEKMA